MNMKGCQGPRPRILPLPFNAVSSFQLLNVALITMWIVLLVSQAESLGPVLELWDWTGAAPSIISVAWILAVVNAINILPMLRFWATRVNHGYTTKRLGFSLSAAWWAYIASVFLLNEGPLSIGGWSFLVIALVCPYEAWRLSRRGV